MGAAGAYFSTNTLSGTFPRSASPPVVITVETNPRSYPGFANLFAPTGKCLMVKVIDTGIGIHQRDHERIFLEFAEEEREHLELLIREYRALIKRGSDTANRRRAKAPSSKRSPSKARARA